MFVCLYARMFAHDTLTMFTSVKYVMLPGFMANKTQKTRWKSKSTRIHCHSHCVPKWSASKRLTLEPFNGKKKKLFADKHNINGPLTENIYCHKILNVNELSMFCAFDFHYIARSRATHNRISGGLVISHFVRWTNFFKIDFAFMLQCVSSSLLLFSFSCWFSVLFRWALHADQKIISMCVQWALCSFYVYFAANFISLDFLITFVENGDVESKRSHSFRKLMTMLSVLPFMPHGWSCFSQTNINVNTL